MVDVIGLVNSVLPMKRGINKHSKPYSYKKLTLVDNSGSEGNNKSIDITFWSENAEYLENN